MKLTLPIRLYPLFLLAALAALSPVRAELLLHYKLDGNLADSSGNSGDLTLGGSGATFVAGGTFGTQLADVNTSFEHAPVGPAIATLNAATGNAVSVSFWAKPNSESLGSSVFWIGTASNRIFQSHLEWTDGNIYWDADWNDGSNQRVSAGGGTTADQLHHYVMAYDGGSGNMTIYKDGAVLTSGNQGADTINWNSINLIHIGAAPGDAGWRGNVDDFAVFDSALSPADINLVRTAGVAAYERWQTNGGTGDWSNSANWVNSSIASGAGSTANFNNDITAVTGANLTANTTFGTLNLTDTNAIFGRTIGSGSGNSLTLDNRGAGAAINNGNNPTTISTGITLGESTAFNAYTTGVGSGLLTLSGIISGAQNIAVNSRTLAGGESHATVLMSGANTYTGGTTINGGTLSISAANNLGLPSGSVLANFTGNGTLAVTGDVTTSKEFAASGGSRSMTFDVDSGRTLTANGALIATGGAGTTTKTGAGTLLLSANNTTLDSGITLQQGTVDFRNAGAMGDNAADWILASGGTDVRVTGNGVLALAGDFRTAGTGVDMISDRVTAGAGVIHTIDELRIEGSHVVNIIGGANVTGGNAGFRARSGAVLGGDVEFAIADPVGGGVTSLQIDGPVSGANRIVTVSGNGRMIIGGGTGDSFVVGEIVIKNGAEVMYTIDNRVINSVQYTIEAGGLLNMNSRTDAVGGLRGAGNVNVGGGITYLDLADGDELFGTISGAGGITLRAQLAQGTQIFSGDNSYAGGTIINAGTLQADHTNALGVGGRNVTMTGGTLRLHTDTPLSSKNLTLGGNAAVTLDRATVGGGLTTNFGAFTSTGGNRTLTVSNGANATSGESVLNFTGDWSSSGTTTTFDVGSNAAVVLSGSTVGGAQTISVVKNGSGRLQLSGNFGTWDGGNPIALNGGTLDMRVIPGDGGVFRDIAGAAGTTLQLTRDSGLDFRSGLTAAGSMAITTDRITAGAGVTNNLGFLTVSGTPTITVAAGTNVTSGTAGLTITGNTTLNSDATFTVNDSGSAAMLLTMGAVTGTGRNLTIGGTGDTTIGGSVATTTGTLVKNDSGTLTLNGDNTYSGTTTVNGGTLVLNNPTAGFFTYTGGNIAINNGSTLQISGTGSNKQYWFNNKQFIFDSNGGGTIDTTATALNFVVYGGSTFTTTGGSENSIIGTAGINLHAGNIANFAVADGPDAADLTVSAPLWNSGGITKTGAGTMTLSAANNSYTGATTVNGGVLALTGTYGSSSFVIASGAVLDLDTSSGSKDYASTTFSGTGTLRKTGANQAVWGGTAATFALSAGSLIDIQGGSFVGGSNANENWVNNHSDLTIAGGAVFNGVEANVRVNALSGAGTLQTGYAGAGYSTFTIGVDGGGGTFSGVIANSTDAGNLTKVGTGTQILTGTNTYTGFTAISDGTLQLGDGTTTGSINNSSGIAVANNATLAFNPAAGSVGITPPLSGAGTVAQNSAGAVVTVADASNFAGSYQVNGGTLAFINGVIGTPGSIHIGGGATFDTLTGSFTPTAQVTVSGTGTLTAGGAGVAWNSYLTLSPGNSPDVLLINSPVTWNGATGGGTYLWEVADASGPGDGTNGWDLIDITGTLDMTNGSGTIIASALVADLSLASPPVPMEPGDQTLFEIIRTTAGVIGFGGFSPSFVNNMNHKGFFKLLLGNGGNSVYLLWEATPEPGTWVLFGLLSAAGVVTIRRRKLVNV